jgi:hypothetical protein
VGTVRFFVERRIGHQSRVRVSVHKMDIARKAEMHSTTIRAPWAEFLGLFSPYRDRIDQERRLVRVRKEVVASQKFECGTQIAMKSGLQTALCAL